MNEEFNKVVFLPKLFYIPRGRELELLNKLSDTNPRSGDEFRQLKDQFGEEIERLAIYGLVELEKDEEGDQYRIKIINKGPSDIRGG